MENSQEKASKYLLMALVIIIISFIAFLVLFKNNDIEFVSSGHEIIPKPLSYEKGEGNFKITESTSIYVKGNTEEETEEIYKIAEYLTSKLKPSTGYEFKIIKSDKVPSGNIYLTTVGGKEEQGNEGYEIEVTKDGVKMIGYKPQGLSRGGHTLIQLLPPKIEKKELVTEVDWIIPEAKIKDKPQYEYRGLMIDVARHFFTVDEVKRQIDLAAQYKINKVHLHLSDDQGWRLDIKQWPDLARIGGSIERSGGEGGYYTQEDFKEIVKYAEERYVEIIPEFDMPGHTNAALSSYGFLNPSGEKAEPYTGVEVGFSSLNCRDEKTYEFIEDIIEEVSAISPSKYIHIGGDEAHKTSSEDYRYFMGRVSKIVEKYGKTPIGWDPSDTSVGLSSDFIVQNWKGSVAIAKKKKMKILVSMAEKAYLDMKYEDRTVYGANWAGYSSIQDAYSWDPTDYAPKELIIGVEAPLWTENIPDSAAMDYMIYPRLLGHSEIGWTPMENRNWYEYEDRLKSHGERLEYRGVSFYKDVKIFGK